MSSDPLTPAPRSRIGRLFADIRAELASNGPSPLPMEARWIGFFCLVCVLLTLFYYYARPGFYRRELERPIAALLDMEKSAYRSLLPYVYWSCSSLLIRVFVPLMAIFWWFRDSPKTYGFRLWKKGHGRIYLGLYLFLLPLLIAASFLPSFQKKYPFYDGANKSLTHFLLYEVSYGVQFASLEAFFRGFIVFALFKRFGYYGVAIMTIPYCMIHFAKPVPETLGAIVAGLALGFMALYSKSWLPGALLHWSVGFTMDVACIFHKGGFEQP